MPVDINIEYDDREVVEALNRLFRAGQDLTPAMREIAGALEDAAVEAFDSERSPSGEPWADLSEHTKRRRSKKKKWPGQILQVSSRLRNNLTSHYDSDSAAGGFNLVYAPTHQLGASEGEFGSTSRGRPIPFGDIPARPSLGRSDDLDAEILDIINRHFEDALRRS